MSERQYQRSVEQVQWLTERAEQKLTDGTPLNDEETWLLQTTWPQFSTLESLRSHLVHLRINLHVVLTQRSSRSPRRSRPKVTERTRRHQNKPQKKSTQMGRNTF